MVRFVARFADFSPSRWLACVVLSTLLTGTSLARADSGEQQAKQQAGREYDRAVQLYDEAQFEKSAEAFLKADELWESTQALKNAMSAARLAHAYDLLEKAARKLLARKGVPESDKETARRSLQEAYEHLSRINLDCAPKPCQVSLDDEAVQPGTHYILPGNHVFRATWSDAPAVQRSLTVAEGGAYDVHLEASHPKQPSRATKNERAHRSEQTKPLPPGVFYAGVGLTLVLAAATTWSGVDTLQARRELPSSPTQGQIDDVRARIRRSNWLFAGTVFTGAVTGVSGWLWVDWTTEDSGRVSKAMMGFGGRF